MFSRRDLFAVAMIIGTGLTGSAYAAETTPYSQGAFDAAQTAGRSILVEIHAPWCPTCKAQAPILSAIGKGDAYKGLVVFRVDFDSQKDAVQRFGARMQSTLITFKGGKETGRSVGDTNADSIAALLAKAI